MNNKITDPQLPNLYYKKKTMHTSSISLKFHCNLLFAGVASICILSGCTTSRPRVQPYRERPTIPEATTQRQPTLPQQPSIVRPERQPYQSPYTPQTRPQNLPSAEQLSYENKSIQPMRSTVRSRVSFYAQQTIAWRELDQAKSRYRSPEQSRKLLACQSQVSALHDAYTKLQIQLFNDRHPAASHDKLMMTLQHLQNRDFTYLEGNCPTLFKQLSTQPKNTVSPGNFSAPLSVPRNNTFRSGEIPQYNNYRSPSIGTIPYGQNINRPEENLRSTPEVTKNYEEIYQQAQSLLKQGKEHEARSMLRDLLANVRQTGNKTFQIKILKRISELEFALRNYTPAKTLYEELQQLNAPFNKQHLSALQSVDTQRENVDAYAALLLSSMTSNPEKDGFTVVQQAQSFAQNYPNSPLRANAEQLASEAEQKAEQWFQSILRQSDRLAANQQNEEALALLGKIPLDILPLDKQAIIQQRKSSLVTPVQTETPASVIIPTEETDILQTAEERQSQPEVSPQQTERSASKSKEKNSSPPQQTTDTELQAKWDKAEAAFQSANYDKAIALFSDLNGTSLSSKAQKRMKKASIAAGQEARKKAAIFFQRANSATDPKIRKKHLLSSKTLLEDILQKYPLAGLDAKVKRNLSRVDKELAALDHSPF